MKKMKTGPGTGVRIEREEKIVLTHAEKHGCDLIRKAGGLLGPTDGTLIGHSCMYYYRMPSPIIGSENYMVIPALDLGNVPEEFASAGFVEGSKSAMKLYGKEPPRERQ